MISNLPDANRIGIFGGTFDPIHLGHLTTAEAARIECGLEKVLFIPAPSPPHKQGCKVTRVMHRYAMTVLATASNPYFEVSTMEMEREGPSYTVDTLQSLHQQYTKTEFFFITGTDAVTELHTWSHIHEILQLCHFITATRPGFAHELGSVFQYFNAQEQKRIHLLDVPELEISATDIRQRLEQGVSVKYLLPEAVENYIIREQLYC